MATSKKAAGKKAAGSKAPAGNKAVAPKKPAPPKVPAPPPLAADAAPQGNNPASGTLPNRIPFAGDKVIYVDADGNSQEATVQAMHGGMMGFLTLHSTAGNSSVGPVPHITKVETAGAPYWKNI